VRLRALQLFHDGWSLTHIARTLRVTLSAVSQWMKRAREQGEEALRAHPAPGPTPRLTTEQHAQLLSLLRQGAPAHGFEGEVWTASRVAQLIATTFGVQYSDRHVRRLLIHLKWSHQTPATRAAKRNEPAIEQWRTERYPELKKNATTRTGPSYF
jgi:transposase